MIVIASENERQEQQRIEMTMVMADGDDKGRQLGVDGGGAVVWFVSQDSLPYHTTCASSSLS